MIALQERTLFECLENVGLQGHLKEFEACGINTLHQLSRLPQTEYGRVGVVDSRARHSLRSVILAIRDARHIVPVDPSLAAASPITSNTRQAPPPRRASRRGLEMAGARRPETEQEVALFNCRRKLSFEDCEISPRIEIPKPSIEKCAEKATWISAPASPVVDHVRVIHHDRYDYGTPGRGKGNGTSSPTTPIDVETNGNSRIGVYVRKRPMLKCDRLRKMNNCSSKPEEKDVVEVDVNQSTIRVKEDKFTVHMKKYRKDHVFNFDKVFDENCSNRQIYNEVVKPMVQRIYIEGTYSTCFAYGASGSGKTYTLIGGQGVDGIYKMAGEDIVKSLHVQDHKLYVSYYEIYMGNLHDLLNKRTRLVVRENDHQQINIVGLMETNISDVDSLDRIVSYGNASRVKGATSSNKCSSRSHAILQFELRSKLDQRVGRFSFVDLAGSEKACDNTTTNKKSRFEGAEINQSLLALKECIRSLDLDNQHTPYRQSKLTHILRNNFQGVSRTAMIANVAPCQACLDNTLNTLNYANRVKVIVTQKKAPADKISPRQTEAKRAAIFHPSNIQLASTPLCKPSTDKLNRSTESRFILEDGDDSPIRGHQLRKTAKERKREQLQGDVRRMNAVRSGNSPCKNSELNISAVDLMNRTSSRIIESPIDGQQFELHLAPSSPTCHYSPKNDLIQAPNAGQPAPPMRNMWTEVRAKGCDEKTVPVAAVDATESDAGHADPYRGDRSASVACVEIDADNEASVESSNGDVACVVTKGCSGVQSMSDSHNSIITHMDSVIKRARRAINCDVPDDAKTRMYDKLTGQVTPEHKWTELPGELSTSGVSTSDETRIAQGKAVKVAGQGAGQGAGHTTNATPSLTAGKQLCVDNSSRVPRKLAVKTAAKVAPKNFTKPGKKIDSKMPREPRSQSISATCRVVVTPSNRPPSTINNPVATGQQTSNRQARNCANRQIVAQTKAGNHEPISAPHQQVKSTTNGAHNGPPPPRSVAGDRGETVMIHLSPRVMRSVAAATAKVVPIRRCQSACRKTEARSGTPAKKNSAVATPRHPVTMATESMVAPPGGGDVVTCSRRDQHPTLANAQVEGRLSDNRVCRRTQMQAGDAEMHSWGHNSTENKSTLATKTDAKEYQFRCQQTTKEHELSRTSTQQPQRRQHRQTGEATDSRMSTCSDSDDNLPTHLQLLQESRARKCEIDAEISQFNRVEQVDRLAAPQTASNCPISDHLEGYRKGAGQTLDVDRYLVKQKELEPERRRVERLSLEEFVDYKIAQDNAQKNEEKTAETNEARYVKQLNEALSTKKEAVYTKEMKQAQEVKTIPDEVKSVELAKETKEKKQVIDAKSPRSEKQIEKVSYPSSGELVRHLNSEGESSETTNTYERMYFIYKHEKHLYACTSFCKNETKLLSDMRQCEISFEDYIKGIEDSLRRKQFDINETVAWLKRVKKID